MVRRAIQFSNRHPFLSMFLGWLVLLVVVLVFVPADPADLGRATHSHFSKDST